MQLWTDIAAQSAISLTDHQIAQLSLYLDLLDAANQTMNLTRISDRSVAEIQHIADALTLLPFLPKPPAKIADIGSGGGVPGIPLAITLPGCSITLIEATKKKAAFLKSAAEKLGLTNITVLDQRAEEVALTSRRESFDVAISRAVGKLDWLAEWSLPLIRVGGTMLAMKGPKSQEEIPQATAAIRKLGGGASRIHPIYLPGAEAHVIISIPKIATTDPKFPRLPSHAKGRPLK